MVSTSPLRTLSAWIWISRPHEAVGDVDHVEQGGIGSAADIDDACVDGGARGGDGGGDGIVDVREVAALVAVSVQPQWLPGHGGVEGAVGEHVGALAGAVDREVPQCDDAGGAIGSGGVSEAELFLGELGDRVRGSRAGVITFDAGAAVGRAVDAGGGGHDEPGDVHTGGGVHEPLGGEDVGVDVLAELRSP